MESRLARALRDLRAAESVWRELPPGAPQQTFEAATLALAVAEAQVRAVLARAHLDQAALPAGWSIRRVDDGP